MAIPQLTAQWIKWVDEARELGAVDAETATKMKAITSELTEEAGRCNISRMLGYLVRLGAYKSIIVSGASVIKLDVPIAIAIKHLEDVDYLSAEGNFILSEMVEYFANHLEKDCNCTHSAAKVLAKPKTH